MGGGAGVVASVLLGEGAGSLAVSLGVGSLLGVGSAVGVRADVSDGVGTVPADAKPTGARTATAQATTTTARRGRASTCPIPSYRHDLRAARG